MNWDAIGAISEAIGAVGVIGSILYAAIQINKNTHATKALSMDSFVADYNGSLRQISGSGELEMILREGLADFESLSKNDQMRFHTAMSSLMLNAGNLYFNLQNETTEKWLAEPNLQFFAAMTITVGVDQWWGKMKNTMDPEFVNFIVQLGQNTPPINEFLPWFAGADT